MEEEAIQIIENLSIQICRKVQHLLVTKALQRLPHIRNLRLHSQIEDKHIQITTKEQSILLQIIVTGIFQKGKLGDNRKKNLSTIIINLRKDKRQEEKLEEPLP